MRNARVRGFGSPLTEHCGAFDQFGCHLRNRAVPTKSTAVGLPALLQGVE